MSQQHPASPSTSPSTYHDLVARSRDASRRYHTNIVGDSDGYLIASTWSAVKVDEFRSLGLQYSPPSKSWYALNVAQKDAALAALARLTPARSILTSSAGLVPLTIFSTARA